MHSVLVIFIIIIKFIFNLGTTHMEDILDESDIKTLKVLSTTENRCFIRNPLSTYDHVANAYVYKHGNILSKQAMHKRFQDEWKINKQLGAEMLTQFAKSIVSEALEKFKKSSKKQQTIDHMFSRISQKKKVRMIFS